MNLILMLIEKQNKQMRKNKVAPIIQAIFKKRECQNEKLLKNIERYEQKEKIKQQESEIHGQKPVKERGRSKKIRVYNS